MDGIVKIVPTLEERKLLRGLDGEYMKQATAVLIEKCSLAALPLHHHEILSKVHDSSLGWFQKYIILMYLVYVNKLYLYL